MENPLLPKEAVVVGKRQEAPDIWTLSLSFKERSVHQRFRFLSGQFNMVGLWGIGEVPISLSSSPFEGEVFLHTIRAVGNVTRALAACESGKVVGVRGPYGNPWPMDALEDRDLLLVAGGIGLAPLRPVIEEWIVKREERKEGGGKPQQITLLYGARTPADLLFSADYSRWKDRGVKISLTVDRTDGGDWPHGRGVITSLVRSVERDPRQTLALLCGPEIMMRLTSLELRKRGFTADQIVVSLERNMKCAVGQCGHCLFGPHFVCKEGPVFRLDRLTRLMGWGM